jgi:hypothetical protein
VGFLLKDPPRTKSGLSASLSRTAAWRQESDSQLTEGSSDLRQRTTLSADTAFNRTTIALAAGWTKAGPWRFGGGLLIDVLTLRSVQSLSLRRETGTFVETAVGSNRATGIQATLRLGLGAQADLSRNLKFGATLRTPGVQVLPGATYRADVVLQKGAASYQPSDSPHSASVVYVV